MEQILHGPVVKACVHDNINTHTIADSSAIIHEMEGCKGDAIRPNPQTAWQMTIVNNLNYSRTYIRLLHVLKRQIL